MTDTERAHYDLKKSAGLCNIGFHREAAAEIYTTLRRAGFSNTDVYMSVRELETISRTGGKTLKET